MENKSKKALERLSEIERIVERDEIANHLINNLVNSATRYVNQVASYEVEIKSLKNSDNYFKEKETVAMLDANRRNYHEALISNLNILNRYLFKTYDGNIPLGGVYSLSPDSIRDRVSVGDWAGQLVFALKNKN